MHSRHHSVIDKTGHICTEGQRINDDTTKDEFIEAERFNQSLSTSNQMIKRIRLKQIVETVVRHQILGHHSTE